MQLQYIFIILLFNELNQFDAIVEEKVLIVGYFLTFLYIHF